jgi:flagellar protein FlgJ
MGYDMSAALGKFQANSQTSVLQKANANDRDKLREAATEFESLFVKQMLDSMRQTLHKEDNLLGGGMAENIFEDMLYTEYSRLMTKSGDFGIARAIVNQYEKNIPSKV